MSGNYSLPLRKARICRVAGVVFLLVAMLWGAACLAVAAAPGFSMPCHVGEACRIGVDPAEWLTDDEQAAVSRDRTARARFDAHVAQPRVRVGLVALALLEQGPLVFVFLGVGVALRRLGARGAHALARALPWLKRASAGAILWAVAQPVVDGLRSVLLYPGTPQVTNLQLPLHLNDPILALLLAVAAYAVAWAIEAGVRAERDLADFV